MNFCVPVYWTERGQIEWQQLLLVLAAFLSLNLSCYLASFIPVYFFNLFLCMHYYVGIIQCSKQELLSVSWFVLKFLSSHVFNPKFLSNFVRYLVRVAGATVLGWGSSKASCKSPRCLLVQQCQLVSSKDIRPFCKMLIPEWGLIYKNNN